MTDGGTDLALWIETSPKFKLKDALHRALRPVLASLNDRAERRRSRWTLLEPREGSPRDIEIRLPCQRLLGEDDQTAAARRFFAAALEDLKACDVMTVICTTLDAGATPPARQD